MAATGFTPISLYYSTTASAVPLNTNLANGELGLNIADMKLYAKNSAGTVTLLASSSGATGTVSSVAVSGGSTGLTTSGGPITTSGTITLAGTLATANGGTNLTSFTSGGVVYASSSSALATGSALTFDGTNLGVGGSATQTSSGRTVISANGSSAALINLNVAGTSKAYWFFDGSNTTFATTSGYLTIDPASTTTIFSIAGTEQMRINTTGLGIGTSSPTYKVDVSVTGNNGIRTTSSAGQQLYLGNTGGDAVVGTLNSYASNLITNGLIRFQVGTAGQFGIGGATYGSSGQVLTSGGASAAPTWSTPSGISTGKSIAMAMIFGF